MEEEFVEVAPGVNVELDAKGDVIGIEILKASKFLLPVAKPLYRHMQLASWGGPWSLDRFEVFLR